MDDEVLGCGGLMLQHQNKSKIYCAYATRGNKSPIPLLPWQGDPPSKLDITRKREALAVLRKIGVPEENATFLALEDSRLRSNQTVLEQLVEKLVKRIDPAFVLVPFSLDLHFDHVAVHRALHRLTQRSKTRATMLEYFIYYRWRLIPEGDIRLRAPKGRLLELDLGQKGEDKRDLIACYTSQTQILSSWQSQPVLTPESIAERCQQSEWFLISAADGDPLSGFKGSGTWLRLAHLIQTVGKRRKDQLVAAARWAARVPARRDR